MSDVNTNAAAPKRSKVSNRELIDANGEIVKYEEDAAGARYTLIDGGDMLDPVDYRFGENAFADKYFAMFGFHTKVGNVANSVLNDKDAPGNPTEARSAIEEFLAQLATGKLERASGVGGPRYDKDMLAAAIVEVLGERAGGDVTHYLERINDEKGYGAKALKNPEVAKAYAARTGKGAVSIDDLA